MSKVKPPLNLQGEVGSINCPYWYYTQVGIWTTQVGILESMEFYSPV